MAVSLVVLLATIASLALVLGSETANASPPVTLYAATDGSGSACTSYMTPCTLAETLSVASGEGSGVAVTIVIAQGTYAGPIVISSGAEQSLELLGSGPASTTIDGGSSLAVQVSVTFSVDVEDMTITGTSSLDGGNVHVATGGHVQLDNDVVNGGGGGGTSGSSVAVFGTSTVDIDGSTIENDSADGVYVAGPSTVTIRYSTISGNGGNGVLGGGGFSGGSITVTNSTITNNGSAGGTVAGVDDEGAGTVAVYGSTITNNTNGGVVANDSGVATLDIGGDILAGNTGVSDAPENCDVIGGAINDEEYNYSADATCPTTLGHHSHDSVSTALLGLGSLAENGGFPTSEETIGAAPYTQSLADSSVVHDAIPTGVTLIGEGSVFCAGTDERGEPRTMGAASACDVGAYQIPATVTLFASVGGSGTCASAGSPCLLSTALTDAESEGNGFAVTIDLAAGTYPVGSTVAITSGNEFSLTLAGTGASTTIINGVGSAASTFNISAQTHVTLSGMTIENGATTLYGNNVFATNGPVVNLNNDVVTGSNSGSNAGAVAAQNAEINVADSTISGAGMTGHDAAVDSLSNSSVSITDSTLTGNPGGGVDVVDARATIDDSTITNSSAAGGYGVSAVSFAPSGAATVSVYGSTISNTGEYGAYADGSAATLNLGADLIDANDSDCMDGDGATITDDGYNFADDGTCTFSAPGTGSDATLLTDLAALANNGGSTQTQAITSASDTYDVVPTGTTLPGDTRVFCSVSDQRGIARTQGSASACSAGAYQYAPPIITSLSKTANDLGLTVTVNGTSLAGVSGASFGAANTAASISSQSNSSLTLTIPSSLSPGSQPIKLTNTDGPATYAFTALADPSVTTTSLLAGSDGTSYSQTLAASGGVAPYTYAIASGALPNGLTLSSAGAITGTPTQGGNFSFTVRVTDANGASSAPRSLSISVAGPAVTINSGTLKRKGNKLIASLSCAGGACTGSATVTAHVTKIVKGHRKSVQITVASGSYSLAKGQTAPVKLNLSAKGKSAHATHGQLTVTVSGGSATSRSVHIG